MISCLQTWKVLKEFSHLSASQIHHSASNYLLNWASFALLKALDCIQKILQDTYSNSQIIEEILQKAT